MENLINNSTLSEFVKDMAFVSTYYIETRYPAEDPLIVGKEDAQECIAIARRVLDNIRELPKSSK